MTVYWHWIHGLRDKDDDLRAGLELCGVHGQEVVFSRVYRRSKLKIILGAVISQILKRSRFLLTTHCMSS
jgi:hypothetical protein